MLAGTVMRLSPSAIGNDTAMADHAVPIDMRWTAMNDTLYWTLLSAVFAIAWCIGQFSPPQPATDPIASASARESDPVHGG